MKTVLICLLAVHGMIHILGFMSQYKLKEIKGFTGITLFPVSQTVSKIFGVIWLVIALLFFSSSSGFILYTGWAYILAVISVILSQIMIIVYWKDAKAGTAANIIILILLYNPGCFS